MEVLDSWKVMLALTMQLSNKMMNINSNHHHLRMFISRNRVSVLNLNLPPIEEDCKMTQLSSITMFQDFVPEISLQLTERPEIQLVVVQSTLK